MRDVCSLIGFAPSPTVSTDQSADQINHEAERQGVSGRGAEGLRTRPACAAWSTDRTSRVVFEADLEVFLFFDEHA